MKNHTLEHPAVLEQYQADLTSNDTIKKSFSQYIGYLTDELELDREKLFPQITFDAVLDELEKKDQLTILQYHAPIITDLLQSNNSLLASRIFSATPSLYNEMEYFMVKDFAESLKNQEDIEIFFNPQTFSNYSREYTNKLYANSGPNWEGLNYLLENQHSRFDNTIQNQQTRLNQTLNNAENKLEMSRQKHNLLLTEYETLKQSSKEEINTQKNKKWKSRIALATAIVGLVGSLYENCNPGSILTPKIRAEIGISRIYTPKPTSNPNCTVYKKQNQQLRNVVTQKKKLEQCQADLIRQTKENKKQKNDLDACVTDLSKCQSNLEDCKDENSSSNKDSCKTALREQKSELERKCQKQRKQNSQQNYQRGLKDGRSKCSREVKSLKNKYQLLEQRCNTKINQAFKKGKHIGKRFCYSMGHIIRK